MNKNKQSHSGKDKSTGRHRSRDSLWTLRRTYDRDFGKTNENTVAEVYAEEVWPPSSSDFNSFHYFVWGESEVWVIAKSRNKTEDLIQKIKEVMGSFDRDTVAKACKSLRPRI
jgi:hypothetical protein